MSISASSYVATRARRLAITNRSLVVAVSALVFVPSVLFATALQPGPALAVTGGCAAGLGLIASGPAGGSGLLAEAPDWLRLLACCGLACIVLLLGGETHLFYTTWDWLTRDAVLADLIDHGAAVAYRVDGATFLLRAPLGLYMLPAAVGHLGGPFAAHVALFVQNAFFLGVILYLLSAMGRGWGHVAILLLFAGVSIIGALIQGVFGKAGELPYWLLVGLDAWHPLFQYSGTLVQFFWVPNHALPGWWLATLLLLQVRGQVDVATAGVSVAGALLWSPLAVVPVAPWLLVCAARHPRSVFLDKRTWLGAAASAGFLPILAYLVLGSGSIAGGSTLEEDGFLLLYLVFVGVQLPVLWYLLRAWAGIPACDRAPLILSGLFLLALPFFHFGPTNDLVMRGSIVALTIVAFVFGDAVMRETENRTRLAMVGWLLVAASSASAIVETGRALATPRSAISDCSLMEAVRAMGIKGLPTNYIVPTADVPSWLIDVSKAVVLDAKPRRCWPDRVPPRYPGYM